MKTRSLAYTKIRFVTLGLLPIVVGFCIFKIYPLLYGLYISFFNWDLFAEHQEFVGLRNYIREISNPIFIRMVKNTTFYALASTAIGAFIGFLFATLLNSIKRFHAFFRAIFFMPVMTSMVAISVVWMWFYQPQFGLFNAILRSLGLPTMGWLRDPNQAMLSIIVMSVWKNVGFTTMILLAGVQNIPAQLFEAAALDGASGFQIFRSITLPCLAPVLLFVTVTGVMNGFKVFEPIYLMTEGGPLDSTRVLAYEIYRLSFGRLLFGRGAALSFILFIIVLVFTLVQTKLGKAQWEY